MPRSKKTNEFVAGPLPTITYKGEKYFVDGRMREVRHTKDFSKTLDVDYDASIKLSKKDSKIVRWEFIGGSWKIDYL